MKRIKNQHFIFSLCFAGLLSLQFMSTTAQSIRSSEGVAYNSSNKQSQSIGEVTLSTAIENDYFTTQNKRGHFYAEVKTGNAVSRNFENERSPLNISVVIDRSGSMSGEKLMNAKLAAKRLVDELNENDYLSVIVYDNAVQVLQSTTRISNPQAIKNKIANINEGGGTNLMGGALKGYEEVKRNYKSGYINRVLLLSDGQANEGITNPTEIDRIIRKQIIENGITISTFGLGNDYNEDLMTSMAEAGNGNYYFIRNANDLASIFEKELNGISNALAHEAIMKIMMPENVQVTKVFGNRFTQSGRVVTINLNTLFANETKGILIQYKNYNPSSSNLQFTSVLTFNAVKNNRVQKIMLYNPCNYTESQRLYNTSFNEWVAAQIALYQSNEQLEFAMKEADKGNYESARQIVKKNKTYMQSQAPSVQKSQEFIKAESVNASYDKTLQNIESLSDSEVKSVQKSSKADNYGIRNKK
jgi:Ca-activated chloride channel homolog